MLLMEPRDEALVHEVNLVAQAARPKTDDIKLGLVDETEDARYIGQLFAAAPPFFTAADYHRSHGGKAES